MPDQQEPCVTIVGGGLSGTLAAAQLLRLARAPLRIRLVERSSRIASGVAYGTRLPDHYLNVRAGSMGALAGEPGHLLQWMAGPGAGAAARWKAAADPNAFLPRGLYAEYLASLLVGVESAAPAGVVLERIHGEAVEAIRDGTVGRVRLADGRSWESESIVLALGNPLPAHPTEADLPFYRSTRYVRDPWSESALADLDAGASVLIVGSNLTMIDMAVALARREHRGPIRAISRHGLVPPEHRPAESIPPLPGQALPPRSLRGLALFVREVARSGVLEGKDWRPVIDAVRPHAVRLWLGLPERERRRFLRHVRPFWEIHRHRAAPANMEDIGRLRRSGQLTIRAGRIRSLVEDRSGVLVTFLPRGASATETLRADRVLNATGPASDLRRIGMPLVDRLFEAGFARPGPLGMGLDASPEGILLDASGRPSPVFQTLGPPLRGVLWETTAVPEIREQAAALAERILGGRVAATARGSHGAQA